MADAAAATASGINFRKTRVLIKLDVLSRDWETVKLAKVALNQTKITPQIMWDAALRLGYAKPEDENHVLNDWANVNGRGWFGDIFAKVLVGFRDALAEIQEPGPYLDVWWIEGVLTGKNAEVLPPVVAGDKVGLFILTSSVPTTAEADAVMADK